jgi:hypothetical protein
VKLNEMFSKFLKSAAIVANGSRARHKSLPIRFLSVCNAKFSKITVKTNFQNETIELYEDENKSKPMEFPFIWLRDNCSVRRET